MNVYECQVCGETVEYVNEQDKSQKTRDWIVQGFTTQHGRLSIITCPGCSWMTGDAILSGYKLRIAQGHDLRYH